MCANLLFKYFAEEHSGFDSTLDSARIKIGGAAPINVPYL